MSKGQNQKLCAVHLSSSMQSCNTIFRFHHIGWHIINAGANIYVHYGTCGSLNTWWRFHIVPRPTCPHRTHALTLGLPHSNTHTHTPSPRVPHPHSPTHNHTPALPHPHAHAPTPRTTHTQPPTSHTDTFSHPPTLPHPQFAQTQSVMRKSTKQRNGGCHLAILPGIAKREG